MTNKTLETLASDIARRTELDTETITDAAEQVAAQGKEVTPDNLAIEASRGLGFTQVSITRLSELSETFVKNFNKVNYGKQSEQSIQIAC